MDFNTYHSRRPTPEQRKGRPVRRIIGFIIVVAIVVTVVVIAIPKGASRPTYQTLTPRGKSISSLGGWHRVSPPGDDPVFMYVDTIGNVDINVSEQPLPHTFISDINSSIATLAKQYNATDKIDARDTTIYVGTSVKGPQSAIFAKRGLLVLIKSRSRIDRSLWISYVDSLQ